MSNASFVNDWFNLYKKEINTVHELISSHIKNRDVITDSIKICSRGLVKNYVELCQFLEIVPIGVQNTIFVTVRFKIKLDYSVLNNSDIENILEKI